MVSVELETHRLGGVIVGVLVRTRIDPHRVGHHVAVSGERAPVAVIVKTGDRVNAFTCQGRPTSVTRLQALYPEALADFLLPDTP